MSDLNINGVDISSTNISDVYLDLKRNITVTLKDSRKIVIEKNETWRETYNELTGYYADDK